MEARDGEGNGSRMTSILTAQAPSVDFAWLQKLHPNAVRAYLHQREAIHNGTRAKAAWAWDDVLSFTCQGIGPFWLLTARVEMMEYARQVAVERAELRMIRDILAAKEAA
jgi:hypothetical protein